MGLSGGGYGITIEGLDKLEAALSKTASGMDQMGFVYARLAAIAFGDVRSRVPEYHGMKPGKTGVLKDEVRPGHSNVASWVDMADRSGVLMLQEFGGHSFWHGSGHGAVRKLNYRHEGVVAAAGRYRIRGHLLYTKPRRKLGYFLWNVAFRRRAIMSDVLVKGVADVCKKNGIAVDASLGGSLDMKGEGSPP